MLLSKNGNMYSIIILNVVLCLCVSTFGHLVQNQFFDTLKVSINKRNPNDFDSNEQCYGQLMAILNGFAKYDIWALQVVDSWGKLPSGILYGNFFEFGNFDECIAVNYDSNDTDIGVIKGKYCLASLGIHVGKDDLKMFRDEKYRFSRYMYRSNTMKSEPIEITIGYNLGVCIPASCPAENFSKLIGNEVMSHVDSAVSFIMQENNCHQADVGSYSYGAMFTIVFFSFIATIMIASTLYDLIAIKMKQPKELWLIAFSMYSNGEKLFKCRHSDSADIMECLHGIRFFSIIWVIFGHTYITFLMTPTINMAMLPDWIKNPYSMTIIGANVSVDSFFLLSGLLVAWSICKHMDKTNGKINFLPIYLHRYLRLTPALGAAILLYTTIWKYAAIGPISKSVSYEGNCATYWWSALLYIQNYYNPDNTCFGHAWYLSVDMQLFIIAPIFVYPLWKMKYKFLWVIPVVVCMSIAYVFCVFNINGYIRSINTLTGDPIQHLEIDRLTYFPTHIRIGAYLVGILLGYFLNKTRAKTINIPKPIVTILWTLSIGAILAIVYGIYWINQPNHGTTTLESSFHESFHRVGWALALSWIIFACINDYGGPVNWFLSLPLWQPFSRLSYSLYIVHLPIQLYMVSLTRTTTNFSDLNAFYKFWGNFGFSLCAAILWTLAFESPVIVLENIIFKRNRTPKIVESTECINDRQKSETDTTNSHL